MDYRCIIIGDPVAEPGALLRRLMRVPFTQEEEDLLAQHSLRDIRTAESDGSILAMAVAPLNPDTPQGNCFTLPNPSMPSVDISVSFGLLTSPQDFERFSRAQYSLYLPNSHNSSSGVSGGSGPLPRPLSSYSISAPDLNSSTPSSPSAVGGVLLHAPPHAILLAYNPFTTASVSSLAMEWDHSLRVMRQLVGQQAEMQALQQQRHPSSLQPSRGGVAPLLQNNSNLLPLSSPNFGSPEAMSPLLPQFNFDGLPSTPPVVLVATRLELLREAMESTPLVPVPSPLDVAEVASQLGACAYVEVDFTHEATMEPLRTTVARACMGEMAEGAVVDYYAIYAARYSSLTRSMEAIEQRSLGEEAKEEAKPAAPPFENKEAAVTQSSSSSSSGTAGKDPSVTASASSDGAGSARAVKEESPRETASLQGRRRRQQLRNSLAPLFTTVPQSVGKEKAAWTFRHHPKTGRIFFVHRPTRRAQYEQPPEYDGPSPPKRSPSPPQQQSSAVIASSVAHERPPETVPPPPAPAPLSISPQEESTAAAEAKAALHGGSSSSNSSIASDDADDAALRQLIDRQEVVWKEARLRRLQRVVEQLRSQCCSLRDQSRVNAEAQLQLRTLWATVRNQQQLLYTSMAADHQAWVKESLQLTQEVKTLTAQLVSTGDDGEMNDLPGIVVCSKEKRRLELEVRAYMDAMTEAISRRDANAAAAEKMKRKIAELMATQQATEAEVVQLRRRLGDYREKDMAVREELHTVRLKEWTVTMDRLQRLEERASQRVERRLQLMKKMETQEELMRQQIESMGALQQVIKDQQQRYAAAVNATNTSKTLTVKAAIEKRELLQRKSRGVAVPRCAERLLHAASALLELEKVFCDVRELENRLDDHRRRTHDRLARQWREARQQRLSLLSSRYDPEHSYRGVGGGAAMDGSADWIEAAAERAETAWMDWKKRDGEAGGPLSLRARRIVAALGSLLKDTATVHRNDGVPMNAVMPSSHQETEERVVQWMSATLMHLRHKVEAASCQQRDQLSHWVASSSSPSSKDEGKDRSDEVDAVIQIGQTLEADLWEECHQISRHLKYLTPRFLAALANHTVDMAA